MIGVIASHSGLFGLGWVGVDIFFGLSGYLITGILLDAKAADPRPRAYFVPFYMRRALRILPLAWAVALIAAAIEGQWSGLLWYMGYLVNWLPDNPPPDVLGHYWSLAVEEQFYLVWPAVVLFAPRRALPTIIIGLILVDVLCRFTFSTVATVLRQPAVPRPCHIRPRGHAAGRSVPGVSRAGGGLPTRGIVWTWAVALAAGTFMLAIHRLRLEPMAPILIYNLKWPIIAAGVGAGLLIVLTRRLGSFNGSG